ncbi:hypothetical protein [Salipiger mucosus]|uniref:hypothetical protein n=1 Tax=Salipiger mucosus TaxID=263378 RepID=UPI0003747192|nr:hypothetical protein [Salipiger mucosus]
MQTDITIGAPEAQRTAYCIEVDTESFRILCKAEKWGELIDYDDHLLVRLGDPPAGTRREPEVDGISNVEYDGHFGAAIHYDPLYGRCGGRHAGAARARSGDCPGPNRDGPPADR